MSENEKRLHPISVNRLPAITWHRLQVNESKVLCPVDTKSAAVTIERTSANAGEIGRNGTIAELSGGMGTAYDVWIRESGVCPLLLQPEDEEVLRLHIGPRKDAPEKDALAQKAAVLPLEITVRPGQSATVIMDYDLSDPSAFLAVQTKVLAMEETKVRLIQLLPANASAGSVLCSDVGGICRSKAAVETVQVFLGAGRVYAGCEMRLEGADSSWEADLAYRGERGSSQDFNWNAVHLGPGTKSRIQVEGVLADQSRKNFRGTIDFKTGAKGAVGAETENVLLLGDDVVNQTVPLILCAEEEVEGSHGASAGQLDEDLLFYMASRGITEEQATELMADARIGSIVRKIRDTRAEALVSERGIEETGAV